MSRFGRKIRTDLRSSLTASARSAFFGTQNNFEEVEFVMKRLAYLRPRCFDFLPQRSRRRPAARATKINTESLEVRSLLAGNVLASIQAGGLTLQGDNLDNDVRIDFDATTFSISGLNGTTINGDASFSRPISEISGVNRIGISLGNGNDSLGVFGTLPE